MRGMNCIAGIEMVMVMVSAIDATKGIEFVDN
jgi:hypothetical protein